MGNSVSPSATSDNSDADFPNPQCLASNFFTDESSEEEFDWNPCCPERDRLSLVKIIDQMVTYMRGIFVTKEIQDVMKTVMREHFVYNTGAKVRSVHYNLGEEQDEENSFHICFAPRRELSPNTNFVEFLEKLQLSPGHFFLHLGSGTGYLSTLAGLLIGASGVNHGVEVNPDMLAYAEERQNAFRDHCVDLQKFEYCEPMFILGDCLKMEGDIRYYDRIFCSGMLPQGYENLLKLYLKEKGILIFPRTNRSLVVVKRDGKDFNTEETNTSRPMDFYKFKSTAKYLPTVLPDELLPTLQQLSRGVIREHIRSVQPTSARKRDHTDSSSEPPSKRLYLSDAQVISSNNRVASESAGCSNSPQASDNLDSSNNPQASCSNDNGSSVGPSSSNNLGCSNSLQASPSVNLGSNNPQASSSNDTVSSVGPSSSDNLGCSNSPQASSNTIGGSDSPETSALNSEMEVSSVMDHEVVPQDSPETSAPNPGIEAVSAMDHEAVVQNCPETSALNAGTEVVLQNSPETSAPNPGIEAVSGINHEPVVQDSLETSVPNSGIEAVSAMDHEAVPQNRPEISAPNPGIEAISVMDHEPIVQNSPETSAPNPGIEAVSAMDHEVVPQNSPETSVPNPGIEAVSEMDHEAVVQNSPETSALNAGTEVVLQNSPETSASNSGIQAVSALINEAVQSIPVYVPERLPEAVQENPNDQVIFYVNPNSPQEDADVSVVSDSSEVSTIPYEDSSSDDFPSPAYIQPRRFRTLSYDSADSENERIWRRQETSRRRTDDDVLSSDPDLDELFAPGSDADYCSDCDLELEKSVPQKVKPYNPNEVYPPNALNTKINSLPLPKHLKWYLKYKHNLVFPLQPTNP